MIVAAIILAVLGVLMTFKPEWLWTISESWKSSDATGPTELYIKSIRIGGIVCTLAAIVGGVAILTA